MLYLKDAFETLTGYPKEKFLRREISFRDLYHPDDSYLIQPEREEQYHSGLFHAIYRIQHRSGNWLWVEDFGKGVYSAAGELLFLEGSITDITERKQAEMLQSALYRIATVANADLGLEQLYPAIHAILGDLMDVRNFYIALVEESSGHLHLPYFVDEVDTYDGQPFDGNGGLTQYVLETGQPQLLSRMELKRLIQLDLLHVIGAMPEVWLGAPLRTQARVFGALVVQSYRDGLAYTEREKQLLFFVSGQVAAAIERKRSEDQLRAMAAEIVKQARIFEEVLSTTPDQFVVYDRDGRITFASPSLLKGLKLSLGDVSGKTMADLAVLPQACPGGNPDEGEPGFT
jgi:PAS domain S-box-containing protein